MSGSTSSSTYFPLDPTGSQIRLIYLQPRLGSDSDTVCSLHLADLNDESCLYNALSYEWKFKIKRIITEPFDQPFTFSKHSRFTIILNGERITVEANLWESLRALSNEPFSRPIWVDALCINQKDDIEKSSQVSQMGRIYQRASCVIAWLGYEDDPQAGAQTATQQAMELAELLHGTSESTRYYYCSETVNWRRSQHKSLPGTSTDTNVPVTYLHPGWPALLGLFRTSYWDRLWILQELVLAPRIVVRIGRWQMSWEALEHIHHQISNAEPVSGNNYRQNDYARRTCSNEIVENISGTVPFKILQQRVARRTMGHESHTLFELVQIHRSAKCANLRDKVFGLIGMCSQCCNENVVVDYQKPPIEICRMMLEHYLSSHSTHDLSLSNDSSVDLSTLVKEILFAFTDGGMETGPPETGDPFPEVFEEPQPDSISMIACVPRRSYDMKFQASRNSKHWNLLDCQSGKTFHLWRLYIEIFPDPEYEYRMYKVNRIHFLILREYQNRLSLVGIAQEDNDRGLLMDTSVQIGEQVRNMEEAPSKDCLYLNFRALKDMTLLLNNDYMPDPVCLLLGRDCVLCDCWNKRHFFDLESRGPLGASE